LGFQRIDGMESNVAAVLAGKSNARKRLRWPWQGYRLTKANPMVIDTNRTLPGDGQLSNESDQIKDFGIRTF
jgi:hypothetical protein